MIQQRFENKQFTYQSSEIYMLALPLLLFFILITAVGNETHFFKIAVISVVILIASGLFFAFYFSMNNNFDFYETYFTVRTWNRNDEQK